MASPLIEARDLVMQYGNYTAVDHVSFSVEPGSVVGFLGPNGAGKSTTMRMLTGYRAPLSGEVTIGGFNSVSQRRQAQSLIGYLPEAAAGFSHLTTIEFLQYCCAARGLRGSSAAGAINQVLHQLDLAEAGRRTIGTLSKGWRQRVWLAQAIVHQPDVLILDEPTDGLDPVQKRVIRQLISNLADHRCVILSTHILEEAEAVCDRAIVINQGKIVSDTTVDSMKDGNGSISGAFYALVD